MASSSQPNVTIIGAGLAGSEAAWQLAQRGVDVRLVEMRPHVMTPAHHTGDVGELVCSNSFKSSDPIAAAGVLKHELETLGSIVLQVARDTSVAAGGALAVDRERFSSRLTEVISTHHHIELVREEATSLPEGHVIIATGPLTSPGLEPVLTDLVGSDRLAFFDAAAPIVEAASIDRSVVFAQSRYDKGGSADYLNAPFERESYETFIDELLRAERIIAKDFESKDLFSACQPVEEVARSGRDAPRFGALKPVGLIDPRTGRRPWAVVQLRAENEYATAYNLVGFQTNLTFPEQRRVFSMIPGLEGAEFLRYGVMHRNTFIDAPRLLDPTLRLKAVPRVRFAGQITGTEGYLEAAASGLIAGMNTAADLGLSSPMILPSDTVLGALLHYATNEETIGYQPMHVNFGIVPPLIPPVRGKKERYLAYSQRAARSLNDYLSELGSPAMTHRE